MSPSIVPADPHSRRLQTLRTARLAVIVGLVAVEGVAGYDLWTVDTGTVAVTDTMLPVGALYDIAGFWHTLLGIQVVCAALWAGMTGWIGWVEKSATTSLR